MRWLYALGVDHSKQIWFQTSELIMDEKHSDWWITEVEKPASELHLYSLYIYVCMYVYTYWFRFHLPGSNASAHIKYMCSFNFVAGCDTTRWLVGCCLPKSPMTMGQSDGIRRAILWYFIQKALHLGNPPLHPQGSASWPRAPYLSQVASGKWLKFTPWSIAEHIHI